MGDYRYGDECQQGAGPHALCETGDGDNESKRYWYDANGSMVGDSSGRRIEYSSFDKPTEISKDDHTTRFAYNPSRARYLRTDENAQGATTLTRYLGNVERITHPDGRLEIKRRLPGGALISYTRSAGGQPAGKTTHYLHKDHLGSIDTISNEIGQLVAQMSFDPWGQRRNPLDWDALVAKELREFNPDITGITKRGFTGHEMLDEVGLIHMNGRIYDPRLGRFLQADPMIDGVTDTQGYNRYSYVGNNPLSYTDPTGYFKLREFAGLIVGAAITWATGGLGAGAFASTWYGAATIGAAAGAAGAAANGGNIFKGAILGGISGAAFSGAGSLFRGSGQLAHLTGGAKLFSQTIVHGTVGGITSVLRGGKFGHGFATAGVAKFFSRSAQMLDMGKAGQFFAATISGGTASKITGGKFANGATTAALAYAVNQAASEGRKTSNAQERGVTKSDEGIYLAAEDSKSGFQISDEGAVQVFEKVGLSNIPDVLSIDESGILLADDMLTAAVPAQDLISALEPSPFGKLKTLITGTKIITNGLKTEAKSYWRDTIDDVSLGMGARAGVKYNHELMNRYQELPR